MPALSSSIYDDHHVLSYRASTIYISILVALAVVLIRRQILFGSVFSSSSRYQVLSMSAHQTSGMEKNQPQYRDGNEREQSENEREHPLAQSSHARTLSSQPPRPTIKPCLPPISSSSNAEYFTNSPMSETPSTFSPSTTYSQSTSFSESPESQTRRRSYTKTLSLPLPNHPIQHPSANASFPTPTAHPAPMSSSLPDGSEPNFMMPEEKIIEVEVQGEIIVAEGWRRHTRVFGGGVCKACEESKQELERRGMA